MKKTFKIIQIIILILAGLGIYNLMTSYGLNTAGRYQYRDFESGHVIRLFADLLLLTALLILTIRKWTDNQIGLIHILFSVLYIVILMVDIRIWLWMTDANPVYYSILFTYSLSLIIIVRDLINLRKFDSTRLVIAGVLILILGFLFDIIFIGIPYQDAPSEIYDKIIFNIQIKRVIYYIGLIISFIGVINLTADKIKITS